MQGHVSVCSLPTGVWYPHAEASTSEVLVLKSGAVTAV
jgi:hypothetical protein